MEFVIEVDKLDGFLWIILFQQLQLKIDDHDEEIDDRASLSRLVAHWRNTK